MNSGLMQTGTILNKPDEMRGEPARTTPGGSIVQFQGVTYTHFEKSSPTLIDIQNSQRPVELELHVWKYAAVRGRVLDERGDFPSRCNLQMVGLEPLAEVHARFVHPDEVGGWIDCAAWIAGAFALSLAAGSIAPATAAEGSSLRGLHPPRMALDLESTQEDEIDLLAALIVWDEYPLEFGIFQRGYDQAVQVYPGSFFLASHRLQGLLYGEKRVDTISPQVFEHLA